ncbi:uncharacterized monothiol glutaredoxin F10D7.3-like [Ruditapes philippinarum]|uniref:uncharacterized monothiol glutaredoxin F10D7.3-like n=1 Tax=Ruditapes philippinarum TaxID=129788 RepID=UPI00295BDA67|nr:uncharacterized monothiol glutaredoxin F10D7.3-like [Ruditapes philippinarum]
MADVRKIIEDKIAKNKVMMFSKSYCPYCTMAKTALSNYNLGTDEYKIWEIEREPNCAEIQSVLRDITGAQSVPRVFINGKCIGGGSETKALHESGQLQSMLM